MAAAAVVKPVKPAEEIIELKLGSLGGGNGAGSSRSARLTGSLDEEKPPEPKPRRLKEGAALRKFSRGAETRLKASGDTKLNGKLRKEAGQNREALLRLVKGEVLQTEATGFIEEQGPLERSSALSQAQLLEGAPLGAAKKHFAFKLPYGPYCLDFTSNGQHLLAGGRKGQVAMMHVDTMQISAELQLKETIRAVQPLHNHTLFAVAQKKYVHMYDQQGTEIHCLKDHKYITHMDFLPYHFLMVSAGEMADLHYRDISTGQEVASLKTRHGPCRSLRQNPTNAVMHVGHSNGTVTLWTPKVKEAVVKVACHSGHVTGLAVHKNYMMTAGAEGYWKVWDLRKYEPLHTFKTFGHAITDADFSMTGLLAVAFGSHVQVWRDPCGQARPQRCYIREDYHGKMVTSVRFRPYEDVLGVGHSDGFGGLIIPGAGYANFDSFEANPFETKRQRQEREVRRLMEKLQPDSIMLDPNRIGNLDGKIVKEYQAQRQKEREAEEKENAKQKKKMRGKNKVGNRMKRKKLQEGAGQRSKARDRVNGEEGDSGESESDGDEDDGDGEAGGAGGAGGGASSGGAGPKPAGTGTALGRFYGKRKRKT